MGTQKKALLLQRNAELEKELAAKNRELQIEAALEKVRARTMTMHKSEELAEAAKLLFQQVQALGLPVLGCGYNVWQSGETICTGWMSDSSGSISPPFRIPLTESPTFIRFGESRQKGELFYVEEVSGEALAAHYRYMLSLPNFKSIAEGFQKAGFALPAYQVNNVVNFSHGNLIFITDQPVPEAWDIFKRFARVFEQAYTRFLDLQKAEAQTRELQIELGLERVRATAMAMQNSDELNGLVAILFDELINLDLILARCIIWIFDPETFASRVWMANSEDKKTADSYYIKKLHHPYYEALIKGWKERNKKWVFDLSGEDKKSIDELLFNETELSRLPEAVKRGIRTSGHTIISGSFNKFGFIEASGPVSHSEEQFEILNRFGKVFDLSYTRFNDLKQAEAQAREAQIELGLERVRARAMAMQKSDDLAKAVAIIFEELDKLNIGILRCGIGIINKENRSVNVWTTSKSDENTSIQISGDESMDSHPLLQGAFNAWLKQEEYSYRLHGKDLTDYYKAQATANFKLPDSQSLITSNLDLYQYYFLAPFQAGGLFAFRETDFPDETKKVMKRFAGVFNLTYKRFLDLKKAEAQVREAQIQLAMERVRARTMAMQKSDELNDVAGLLFKQVSDLGIKAWTTGFNVWSDDNNYYTDYVTSPLGGFIEPYTINTRGFPVFKEISDARKRGEEFFVSYLEGEMLKETYLQLSKFGDEQQYEKMLEGGFQFPSRQFNHFVFGAKVSLMFITYEPVPEAHPIFKRFGKVFEQTYTRFLDLQKAEAQAREAQIELALERVRARTMAMQKSDELSEVASILFKQVNDLGIKTWTTGFNVWSDDNNFYTDYVTNSQGGFIKPYTIDATEFSVFIEVSNAKKRGDEFYVQYVEGEMLKETYRQLSSFANKKQFEKLLEEGFEFPSHQYHHFVFGAKVSLMFITYEPIPEAHDTFKRFGKVFEQTYTRFLDLQKAEAQAREAQIEAALERLRSRSMAMHKSGEVMDVAVTVYDELQKLDFKFGAATIIIMDEKTGVMEHWLAGFIQKNHVESYQVNNSEHPLHAAQLAAWREGAKFISIEMSGPALKSYAEEMFTQTGYRNLPDEEKAMLSANEHAVFNLAYMRHGALMWAPSALSVENAIILQRFAKVFEQTYTRFLDLQKAEAQTKDAQIEAALERVRSEAMAMHSSEGLLSVTLVLREQMAILEQKELESILIHIYNEKNNTFEAWFSYRYPEDPDGKIINGKCVLDWTETKRASLDKEKYYLKESDYTIVADYSMLKEWYEYLEIHVPEVVEHNESGDILIPDVLYYNYSKFSGGTLLLITNKEASTDSKYLLKRSAEVFNLAYTRFLDLQKTEAQAREAKVEAALERVRSRTLAMQKSDELAEASAVLFKQLIGLGIEPHRLYFTIIKDNSGEAEFWITDEDGTKVSSAYTTNLNDNKTFKKMFSGWQEKKKSLVIDMQGEELRDYFSHLINLKVPFTDGISHKRRIQHLAYFNKGFIGMASPDEQPDETLHLLERFAAVFNLTFTRFNDLKIAEAHAVKAEEDLIKLQTEKKRAEDALSELQVTQKQLIQSEKMASLGELTAGIAHEIQNPLNFVNNFSEVNKEMLVELNEELDKGNYDDAKAIANDVIANEEKINHHGKRADAIVKGMLQHSRKSEGIKEPTDINALCDEYLRLSYHGLRAKNKSFNADFKTDFDNSIGKINIVPQDIGRVLLNLINNAFYAVNERQKITKENYQPTVFLSSKKMGDKVILTVKDNGNGIPQNIVDKIFQPFFTTKPTGQGTGLGLSLSYDIIKAHGGEIKVETKEVEGSSFTVQLQIV